MFTAVFVLLARRLEASPRQIQILNALTPRLREGYDMTKRDDDVKHATFEGDANVLKWTGERSHLKGQ